MIHRRRFPGTWLPALMIAGVMAWGAPPGQALADDFGEGAKKFVATLADDAITSLTINSISSDERARRFRALMLENFAIKGIARFVLGRHWRRATDAQREEYLRLFEDLLVAKYADRFAKYSGETLDIKKADVRGEKDALVHSTIVRVDGAKPLKVAWRVRGKGDKYRIVDIMVEGISMVQTQKSEFASFIKQNSDDLEALLSELRKRIQANT